MSVDIPPILILAYNRPEKVERLLQQLAIVQPRYLFFAQDGPHPSRPHDLESCKKTRDVLKQISWECTIHKRILRRNLGCQLGVSSAISWFFSQVEHGIILEDDCVPDPTFFPYCTTLLHRYAEDTRIMHISGNTFCPPAFQREPKQSYYFSSYPHCWGWATWKRAWKHFDRELLDWPSLKNEGWLSTKFQSPLARRFWSNLFSAVHDHRIDSWAIPWVFSCWTQHGISIHPQQNLVSNIGFEKNSTHTKNTYSPLSNIPTAPLRFPLIHPTSVLIDWKCDRFDQLFVYEQRTIDQLLSYVKFILFHESK